MNAKVAGNKSLIKGSIAVGFSAILWGFDGVVLTPQLFRLDPLYVVFVLHLVPFLIMNLFLWREYLFLRLMTTQDLVFFILVSLFGGAIGTLAIVKALFLLNFNNLSIVVLLQKLQPVFAITLAHLLLREPLRKNFLLYASMAIIGGYFLTFEFSLPDFQTGSNTALAALLAIVAAFSFGSSTVFSKKVVTNYHFVTSTFYRYGFTSLIMLVVMLLFGNLGDFFQTSQREWFFIFLIGITTGSGAIFLYYYGLRKVKAIVATISELLFPISAVLFDFLINGTRLSVIQWLAAAVMVFAIIKLNKNQS